MGRKEVKQEVPRKKFYRFCPKYKKEFAFFQYRKRLNRKIECVKNPMRLQRIAQIRKLQLSKWKWTQSQTKVCKNYSCDICFQKLSNSCKWAVEMFETEMKSLQVGSNCIIKLSVTFDIICIWKKVAIPTSRW